MVEKYQSDAGGILGRAVDLAVVFGVVGGVGFTIWQLAPQDTGRFAWLVDAATDLSELEKNLNHLSEKGFGVHRILSVPIGTEQSTFVIVGPSIDITPGLSRHPIVIGS